MKRLAIVMALLAPISATAQDKSAQDRLFDALSVEWFIANCDQARGLSAISATMAAMIINGSTVHDVDAARETVRARISSRYATPQEACTALEAWQNTPTAE